mmetsp:Transcript_33426/g.76388  ORF Transcript_33426/g.76388 Transcript_33426/m.76388 type:complete len:1004 (-) Transcript_33426:108-3119(-)
MSSTDAVESAAFHESREGHFAPPMSAKTSIASFQSRKSSQSRRVGKAPTVFQIEAPNRVVGGDSVRMQWAWHQAEVVGSVAADMDGLKATLMNLRKGLEEYAVQWSRQETENETAKPPIDVHVEWEADVDLSTPGMVGTVPGEPLSAFRTTITEDEANKEDAHFVAETLPMNWPRCLKMWEGLETLRDEVNTTTHASTVHHAPTARTNHTGHRHHHQLGRNTNFRHFLDMEEMERGQLVYALIRVWLYLREPESYMRVAWKALSHLLLLYEAVLIPYMLGFEVPLQGWIADQLLIFATFWSVDLLWSFHIGYDEDGEQIVDARRITKNYLRTKFPLDALVVLLDWATVLLSRFAGSTRLERLARLLRLLRMVGLIRLQKLARILVLHILTADGNAASSVTTLILLIIGFVMILNHVQACIWRYVGHNAPTDTGAHWVDMVIRNGVEVQHFEELNSVYQYTCIYHWHLAQLTAGNQGIEAYNTFERIVNIIGLIVALMIACAVVSMLSATLVNFTMNLRQRTQQLRTLQQYLVENNVSNGTVLLALKQAKERVRRSCKLHEKDVQALTLLSTTLRSTLRYEICLPALHAHPFLRLWTSLDSMSAHQLSKAMTDFEVMLPHERLFEAGQECGHVYFVHAGKGEYLQQPQTSGTSIERRTQVPQKKWLAEAAQWSRWIHVGIFEALTPCEIFSMQAGKWLSAIPSTSLALREVVADYAIQFHRRLVNAMPPTSTWPDDLQVPYTDYGQIVSAMDRTSQEIIGLDALKEAAASHAMSDKRLDKLESQVLKGQCVLYLDAHSHLKRVTSGVSLEIKDNEGRSLFQIAKMKDNQATCSMMVPGHMSVRDELPVEAIDRLVLSKLGPLAGHVRLFPPSQEVQTRMSQDLEIFTDYMQLKFPAVLEEGFEIPPQFFFADLNNAVMGAVSSIFSDESEGPQAKASTSVLMFPGTANNATHYLFAWLTPGNLAKLSRKAEPLERFLNDQRHWQQQQEATPNLEASFEEVEEYP